MSQITQLQQQVAQLTNTINQIVQSAATTAELDEAGNLTDETLIRVFENGQSYRKKLLDAIASYVNVKIKTRTVTLDFSTNDLKEQLADYVNGLASFSVAGTELYSFQVFKYTEDTDGNTVLEPEIYRWWFARGSGDYGQAGIANDVANTVTANDFDFRGILKEPKEKVIIDLGEINNTDITEVINLGSTQYTINPDNYTIFQATRSGDDVEYLYVGDYVLIGDIQNTNSSEVDETDFLESSNQTVYPPSPTVIFPYFDKFRYSSGTAPYTDLDLSSGVNYFLYYKTDTSIAYFFKKTSLPGDFGNSTIYYDPFRVRLGGEIDEIGSYKVYSYDSPFNLENAGFLQNKTYNFEVVLTAGQGGGGSGEPNIDAIENTYADVAAMFADQANQTDGYLQFVSDASGDSTVDSGYAYYEYLGTTVGDITDYRKLSEQESMDLDIQALQDRIEVLENFTEENSQALNGSGDIDMNSGGGNYYNDTPGSTASSATTFNIQNIVKGGFATVDNQQASPFDPSTDFTFNLPQGVTLSFRNGYSSTDWINGVRMKILFRAYSDTGIMYWFEQV